jgi:hypothetical protein
VKKSVDIHILVYRVRRVVYTLQFLVCLLTSRRSLYIISQLAEVNPVKWYQNEMLELNCSS